jgi:hypothetical protein
MPLRYRITRARAGEAKARPPPTRTVAPASILPTRTIRALLSSWARVNPAQLAALTVTGCLTSRVAELAVDELAGALLEHPASISANVPQAPTQPLCRLLATKLSGNTTSGR